MVAVRHRIQGIELVDVTKRTVLVTGCDSGFGNILAKLLDERGIPVFAGCLTKDGAETLQDETSSRTKVFQIDITKKDSVLQSLAFVETHLEGQGLWGLVNNAGVMPTFAPIEWTSMDEYEFTCNVNLFGSIFVTKTFLPLVRRTQGRIINICSVMSNCGYPGISSYIVSKSALKVFSICLRRELFNTGVTVHTIEPGGFQTNLTRGDRLKHVMREAYKRADPESKAFYAGNIANYLLYSINGVTKYVSKYTRQVPDTVVHALFAKYPKQEYLVGQDAYLFFKFVSIVPERIADLVLGWPKPYGSRNRELDEEN